MNPTIISLPSIANPSKIDWKLNRMDARFQSPLSGAIQDIVRPGAYWTADMSWNVLSYSDSQALQGWAVQMSRGGFRTAMSNFSYVMQGSGLGSPTISGGTQTGTSLTTAGWTASKTNVLKIGDMIGVYKGKITFVTAPTNTYAITAKDYYGNSISIGTGDGSTKIFNLPVTFYTGYAVYVNGVLQTYTTNYTTTPQHQMLMVTQNVSSEGSGNATINFEPALRFSPLNSSAISLSPTIVFMFSKPGTSMSYTAPRIPSFAMNLMEDITL